MSLTDSLRSEIANIHLAVRELDRLAKGPESSILEDLRVVVYALRLLLKRSHLAKIDLVLIPALKDALTDKDENLLDELATCSFLNEEVRHQLIQMQLSLDGLTSRREVEPLQRLAQKAATLAYSIQRLLDREYNFLLELSDRVLSKERQETLLKDAREIDRKQGFERIQGAQILLSRIHIAN